jgi:hypothetical protein
MASVDNVYPLVRANSQATTSGTAKDFNVPSWAKRITVLFSGVSTSGTSDVIIQLGTSAGFTTSGYVGSAYTIVGSASPGAAAFSSGFLIRLGGAATAPASREGAVILMNVTGNTWTGFVNIGLTNTVYAAGGAGSIALAALLTQVRITTVNGTDTFDAGSVNIMYE